MHQEGGFDYEFVNGSPPDEYLCLVCTLVAKEAHQVNCCGKIICRGCLEKLKKHCNHVCPICRNDLQGKHFLDTLAIRNINHLEVYCENKGRGCTWSGELQKIEQHLKAHCSKGETKCSYCGEIGSYAYINSEHFEECPDITIECPNNGCSAQPKRKSMDTHRQQCSKETISCEFADFGCDHVCLREEMLEHSKVQVHAHLQLAAMDARKAKNRLKTVTAMLCSSQGEPLKHIIKMTSFSEFMENQREFYSPSFLTHPDGYEMCLRVDAAGVLGGKGTHISTFLYLMKGENDYALDWPLRGKFSIEVLNQERDENHELCIVHLAEMEGSQHNYRVSKGRAQGGYGVSNFMSHRDLKGDPLMQPLATQYLKDDVLYFRVAMMEMESSSKPWLAGAMS